MRVVGVIAEYNPFHNGHLYQLKKIKEMYPDSIIIAIISGHFTERGEVSVLNKWDKANVVLKYGVDIVLEIPFMFSIQSADLFSYAALSILNEFKTNTLVFGSECNESNLLFKCADVQINNPKFDSLVKEYILKGNNYPTSISLATFKLTGKSVYESNDILAVSYVKEIIKNKYDIQVVPIKRTSKYLDIESDGDIVSASNIRKRLERNEDISKYVPLEVVSLIKMVDFDLFFSLVKYKIISEKDSLCRYHLVVEGIENRLYKAAMYSETMDDFILKVKTKRYTYNKINRILINIFLGFTKEMAENSKCVKYVKLLGMSKNGQKYYSRVKNDISIPVFTKFQRNDMCQEELRILALYSILVHDEKIVSDEIKKHVILM